MLVARSQRIVGTAPPEIDLHSSLQAKYYCYNCGSRAHGARTCPAPARGTEGNTFVPGIPGARRSVASEWVCARSHPHNTSKTKGPNHLIISQLQQLLETYSDYTTTVCFS